MFFLIVLNETKHLMSTPQNNIRIFLLCIQLFSRVLLILLVTYQSVSFAKHLHHMFILALDMVNTMAWIVSYDWVGINLPLHIWALICLHSFFNNSISLLYHSITLHSNQLWCSHNAYSVHISDLRDLVQHIQFQNRPLPMWKKGLHTCCHNLDVHLTW